MTEVLAPELSALTDDELAARYATGTDDEQAAVLALLARRDELDARRRQAQARRAPVDSEWEQAAYAQYLEAERQCNGYLLSRDGLAAGIDPWPALWTGPEAVAMKRASEELREFWYVQRRITVCAYREQVRDARRIDDEWREMNTGETTGAPERTPAGPADYTNPPADPERSAAPGAVTTPTEDAPMKVIRYAARGAVRAQRRAARAPQAPRPAKRPDAPLSMSEAMDPARRREWARATFGTGTPRTVSVPAWQMPPAPATAAPVQAPPALARPRAEVATVQPTAILPAAPRPQAGGIDGALLWILVRRYLAHYVAFRSEAQANVVTAWVFHAVARDRDDTGIGQLIWRASPRLCVTSKERGSGKSTLLDLLVILTGSRRGKIPKITPARIAQVLGRHYETVILDEAKTIMGSGSRSLELQGIMLAGYTRRTSYEISGQSVSLFGALAYAAKDELITDTKGSQIGDLLDRSLIIRLDPPARPKPEVAERAEDDGELLCRALIAWTDANRAALRQAARDISEEDQEQAVQGANLRSAQISRPLRAAARIVGPVAEADVIASLDELTAGAAGAEAQDLMAQLQDRAAGWGDDILDDSAPGQIVTSADDGDAEWDEEA